MNAATQQLKDKIALVTGASSGIGHASAIELAKRGAKVVVAARRKAELDALVQTIRAQGGEAAAIEADVTREDDIRKMVDLKV